METKMWWNSCNMEKWYWKIKEEWMLHEIVHIIQQLNQELLSKNSDRMHEDIVELGTAWDAWLYGAKIITKINQKKLKQRVAINKDKGIIDMLYYVGKS